ncbi:MULTISPECIES: gluconate:H+ symporter [Staphylococcus]|uniref:Gluconate permease n=1 Tax=Staphylococcus equorum TaxID=246432 RepID=A0AAP7LUS3_9STAP|nr:MULTISPECIES: gluconate:H+ symporter [Staphylococcus]ANK38859.1 high-affinity gluconate transporter [Staphylococcus sp. AntiMn-1]ERH35631.1 Gnt-II system L-idonate transporter IdnT [Staphylococcus equorum UMC-CNS-924]KKI53516.1 Fructuronate transporter GntP [Staphylococcus equorum subsp. equorum]MCE5007744.1 gluconate:H+ symporter [Staphylococcus equorum]MCE5047003.1 gluconate:H+ symporter [Staphylococcus equorum]
MSFLSEHLPLISLVIGVALLLFLNIKLKINSILALIFSAIVVGFINGMKPVAILETIKEGLGSTLGSLALIIGFGAVLGKLMVDSGAAQRIASTLINKFGAKHVQWALIIVGAVFGISVFYEVAFMILAPLVISIAVEAKTPFMKLAITMVAATTLSHSIFPPQAGPTALVDAYNADMGMVYILGIIVFIPSVFMAGIVLPKFMKNMDYPVPPLLKKNKVFSESEMPSFGMSLFIPLIPAILISISTILSLFITEDTLLHETVTFLGSAEISLIIAILTAIVIFGLRKGKNMDDMMKTFESGLKGVATIIFIVGAGGAFKEVILEANVGNYIADIMKDTNISPLIMAWLITALIRIATGQGVVSAITAAGIVGPLIPTFNVSPVLMVLATAVGSNTITHVNDASFWLFKEYFNISIKDTFKTWGVLLLTTSITGLIVVLILDLFM